MALLASILEDHRVNDLAAKDASPSEELLGVAVKPFINHCPSASIAFFHKSLLLIKNFLPPYVGGFNP